MGGWAGFCDQPGLLGASGLRSSASQHRSFPHVEVDTEDLAEVVPYLLPAPLLPLDPVSSGARIKGSSCSTRDDVGRASEKEGPDRLASAAA